MSSDQNNIPAASLFLGILLLPLVIMGFSSSGTLGITNCTGQGGTLACYFPNQEYANKIGSFLNTGGVAESSGFGATIITKNSGNVTVISQMLASQNITGVGSLLVSKCAGSGCIPAAGSACGGTTVANINLNFVTAVTIYGITSATQDNIGKSVTESYYLCTSPTVSASMTLFGKLATIVRTDLLLEEL